MKVSDHDEDARRQEHEDGEDDEESRSRTSPVDTPLILNFIKYKDGNDG